MLTQKCVMVGDSGVGKTCIVLRLKESAFNPGTSPTIVAQFTQHTVEINDITVELNIWDTAGQDRFRDLGTLYFRGSAFGIFVFDISSMTSYTNIPRWIDEFKSVNGSEKTIVICANKTDLEPEYWEVDLTAAEEFAKSHNYLFFSVSALTGHGIDDLFTGACAEIIKRKHFENESKPKMELTEEKQDKSGCC